MEQGWSTIAVNTVWEANNTILKISSAAGNWVLNGTIYIGINVTAIDGTSFSDYYSANIFAGGELGNVTGLKILNNADTLLDYDGVISGNLKLSWNALENATGYEVYRKYTDSTYQLITTTSKNVREATINSLYLVSEDNLSREVSFIVVGINSQGRSSFETATPIILSDKVKPTAYVYYLSGFSGTYTWDIYFSEPMDTASADIMVSDNGNGKLVFTKAWTSDHSYLTVTIKPTDGTGETISENIELNIPGLKDKAGNMLDTTNALTPPPRI